MDYNDIDVEDLRKAAQAVYLITDRVVAADLYEKLMWAADLYEKLMWAADTIEYLRAIHRDQALVIASLTD